MKNVLIDLWFPEDYYDILDYTRVDYKIVCSYKKQYVQNTKGQQSPYVIGVRLHSLKKEIKRVTLYIIKYQNLINKYQSI